MIKKFKFFETFFAQHMRTIGRESILDLCQGFQHEQFPQGSFVFEKDDPSNNKFYVIISGEVGVLMPKKYHRRNKSQKASTTIPLNKPMEEKKPIISSKNNSIEIPDDETLSPWADDGTPKSVGKMNEVSSVMILHRKLEGKSTTQPNLSSFSMNKGHNEVKQEKVPEDNKEMTFEQYSAQFGKYMRTLEQGDGFGELALKNDSDRTASILCKTACEFLVMTKKQFDAIFLKKEREKEEFLRKIFPFINEDNTQVADINYLLYSFKVK